MDHFDKVIEVTEAPVPFRSKFIELQTDAHTRSASKNWGRKYGAIILFSGLFRFVFYGSMSTATPSAARTLRFTLSVMGTSTFSGLAL